LLTGSVSEARAAEIHTKLSGGESFVSLAAQYSDDPSGSNGGAIGRFNPAVFGQDAAKFEDTLAGVCVGQVSQPVQTG
ncbi:peptidylprolyl isomerase, partial [Moraxella porci]|uniref:peptidylprolyl isomerase n=1 Tax=Moraxella porci TaxID=1288392 RepID=UPI002448E664